MASQKFQFFFILLISSLLSSQTTAQRCHYKGPCKTDEDCKSICTGPGEDPTFLICIKNPPINHRCCCKFNGLKTDSSVLE
ncbi:hypothetical protein ISN44_As12g011440 [Arabidopsis suecica]|uniref:Uncharacterized protein n=1 Tax=Arabidopsis suecica TaxID=45249 RepID=A0A8T1YI24_ARASU|nr:hypothetical protein ISN44_As12g011440 [Arabidopsis suecica]